MVFYLLELVSCSLPLIFWFWQTEGFRCVMTKVCIEILRDLVMVLQ